MNLTSLSEFALIFSAPVSITRDARDEEGSLFSLFSSMDTALSDELFDMILMLNFTSSSVEFILKGTSAKATTTLYSLLNLTSFSTGIGSSESGENNCF